MMARRKTICQKGIREQTSTVPVGILHFDQEPSLPAPQYSAGSSGSRMLPEQGNEGGARLEGGREAPALGAGRALPGVAPRAGHPIGGPHRVGRPDPPFNAPDTDRWVGTTQHSRHPAQMVGLKNPPYVLSFVLRMHAPRLTGPTVLQGAIIELGETHFFFRERGPIEFIDFVIGPVIGVFDTKERTKCGLQLMVVISRC